MALLSWTIIKSNISGDKLTIEYFGLFQGVPLRWYAEAIKSDGLVFLVTATAAESHWKELSPRLIESVKSFTLK